MREAVFHNTLGKTYDRMMENVFSVAGTAAVEKALLEIARYSEVRSELPDHDRHARAYLSVREAGNPSERESALIELYLRLHSAGSSYSPPERERLRKRDGITCQAGGFSPLIMAEPFIRPESTVVDLGAGNGLQGLLLQRIRPHRKTLQIELSAELIRTGRMYQRALGIGDDRMKWIHDDIASAPIDSADFVYLYRPAKPRDGGKDLYRAIASRLATAEKPLVIFSVADCLGRFLDKKFRIFYNNEYLTCFYRE